MEPNTANSATCFIVALVVDKCTNADSTLLRMFLGTECNYGQLINSLYSSTCFCRYRIISNIGTAPIKAPPRLYPIFSHSNCKRPGALILILGSA